MLGKTEGFVIRTQDYGEGNKILTVFTKEMGKIGMMAQGARKTKSRFAAVSQPFIQALFFFHMGSSGLATLSQADLMQSFPKMRGDLYKTAYASYISELTDRLSDERQKNMGLYQLLSESFNHMESGKDSEVIARIFEVKILSLFGHRPILQHCTVCQKGCTPWFFSIREGGLMCEPCRRRDPYAFLITDGVARLLSTFQMMDISQLGNINVKNSTKQLLQKIMFEFFDEHVGVRLKSRNFIEQLATLEQIIPRKEGHHGETTDG